MNNKVTISLANAQMREAKNGVKIYSLPTDGVDVLRVSFVFEAGTIHQRSPFVATSTANLLAEGSATMSSAEIAEGLDYYGSYFDVNVDRDYVYLNFCSLSKFVEPTLALAREIMTGAIFPTAEVEIYRLKRKQRLAVERAKVETAAREEFARSLFGADHPYGVSADESAYDALTREDVVAHYKRCYTAQRCFVVCSGRVDNQDMATITALTEMLPIYNEVATEPDLPEPQQRSEYYQHREDAVQSSIRIGRLLFTRSHPDFLGMQLLSTILGGYFGSRLMFSLREQRGYTYGVQSAMVNFARSGYLAIATQVGTDVTSEALGLIYAELERLRTELIPQQELDMVRGVMLGEMMRVLDGPFGIADVTIENILCGEDNNIIESNARRLATYTPEDLLLLAQRYLDSKDMIEVVVGKK